MPVWLLNKEIFISHILPSEYILEYIILRFCNIYISRASYGYKLLKLHSEILSPPNFNAIYDLLPAIEGHWYISM